MRPSCESPPAHTGVKGEGFLLGQSRHIAGLRTAPSSTLSILIWRLTPPQCGGSDSHRQLCARVSSHIKNSNLSVFWQELFHSTEMGSDGNTSPGCQDCCCTHSCRISPEKASYFLLYDNCFSISVLGLSTELWPACTLLQA